MIYSLETRLKLKQNRLQKNKKNIETKKNVIKKVFIKKTDLTQNKF